MNDNTKKVELEAINSFKYLEKDEKGKKITFKSYDPDRDYRCAQICHILISNIINSRKLYFNGIKGQAYSLHELDFNKIFKPEYSLVKFSINLPDIN